MPLPTATITSASEILLLFLFWLHLILQFLNLSFALSIFANSYLTFILHFFLVHVITLYLTVAICGLCIWSIYLSHYITTKSWSYLNQICIFFHIKYCTVSCKSCSKSSCYSWCKDLPIVVAPTNNAGWFYFIYKIFKSCCIWFYSKIFKFFIIIYKYLIYSIM